MNKNHIIVTKHGTFFVNPNGNGVTLYYYHSGKRVCGISNVNWWDKDTITELIETHKALFEDTDTENTLNYITKDNVKEVLERVAEVLGKDEKGFYASRLKQCINKLK